MFERLGLTQLNIANEVVNLIGSAKPQARRHIAELLGKIGRPELTRQAIDAALKTNTTPKTARKAACLFIASQGNEAIPILT